MAINRSHVENGFFKKKSSIPSRFKVRPFRLANPNKAPLEQVPTRGARWEPLYALLQQRTYLQGICICWFCLHEVTSPKTSVPCFQLEVIFPTISVPGYFCFHFHLHYFITFWFLFLSPSHFNLYREFLLLILYFCFLFLFPFPRFIFF